MCFAAVVYTFFLECFALLFLVSFLPLLQSIAMAPSSIVTGLPPMAGNAPDRTPKLMTRAEIEALVAEGKHITIFHNQVIKMDAWMPFHPGGDKAMLHMVGKDASDEIDA